MKSAQEDIRKALEISELRYRRLFETAQDGVLLIDFDTGMILDVNPFLVDLVGYSKEDFLKKYLWEVGVFKDVAASKENFKTLQTKRFVRFEDLPLETKSGKKIDVEFVANAYQVDGSTIIQCNIRDITDRKIIEAQIKGSEEKYRILYETSGDAIMTLEPPDWRFTSGNPAAVKIFSCKDEQEFISLTPGDLSPEKQPDGQLSADKAKAMIEKAMKEGKNFFEWTHKRYHGEDFPATVLLSRVEVNGKKFLQATVRDIAKEKKEEEQLLTQGEIMKNITEGIYLVRMADGIIVYANPKFEKMFGYNPGEMLNKEVSMVNAPTDKTPEQTKETIMDVLRKTGEWHGEVENIKKDGTTFWCHADVSVFKHPAYGEVLVAVHTDITEQRKKSEQMEQMNQLMTGRELKMVELKKRIAELEANKQSVP